jgi:hypothetical protein
MSEGNGFVTREQLIANSPRQFKEVHVEGLGKVRIRTITESERAKMEAPNYTKKGTVNLEKLGDARCRLLVAAVVDGEGNPLLSNSDVQHLRNKDSRVINELADAISDHCGISQQDMEEIEKNSTAPDSDSR